MIHLIHGEEEFLRSMELRRLKAALGKTEMADLNTTLLDGQKVTLSELQAACDTMPFLADRRLVIVESLLQRLEGRQAKGSAEARQRYLQGLTEYLSRLPDTTDLTFVETKEIGSRGQVPQKLQELANDGRAQTLPCKRKRRSELRAWIRERSLLKKGQISFPAIEVLIEVVGDDLRLLDQELDKLVAYTSGEREIRPEDVRLLVPEARQVTIWEMVDSLGMRDGQQAIVLMHRMLDEGEPPLYLLAMIVRQYRLILQVKELVARGLGPHAISRELRLHSYPTEKLIHQSRRYSLAQLETIYERLLQTDLDIKTGRMEAVLALDVLVAELSAP